MAEREMPRSCREPWPARYGMLDSWRGVAALAVVIQHVTGLRIGDYAVLVFFVISGYCIAAAAESSRRNGATFGGFLWRRIRRIFPPYLLSIAFFSLTRVAKQLLGRGPADLDRPLVHWLQNLTLTQWVSLVMEPLGNAYDNPVLFVTAYWSLCYEEQFYVVVGLLLLLSRSSGISVLRASLGLGVLALASSLIAPSSANGFFLEYWLLFLIGQLAFHRLAGDGVNGTRARLIDATIGGLVALSALAWAAGTGYVRGARYAYREVVVAGLFYAAIVAFRRWDRAWLRTVGGRLLSRLGMVTYSLYLVHQFNLTICREAASWVLPASAPQWAYVTAQLAAHVAIASLFWWTCERPFLNPPQSPRTT